MQTWEKVMIAGLMILLVGILVAGIVAMGKDNRRHHNCKDMCYPQVHMTHGGKCFCAQPGPSPTWVEKHKN